MLVGKTPYHADTSAKLMMMHILEPVPHILDASPELPADFDDVIATAMAKRPDDRFQTTQELADAVRAAASSDIEATFIRKKAPTEASVTHLHTPAASAAKPVTPAPPAATPPTPLQVAPTPVTKPNTRLFLIIGGAILLLVIAVVGISGGIMILNLNGKNSTTATLPASATSGLIAAVVTPANTAIPSETPAPTSAPSATPQPSPLPTDTAAPTLTNTLEPPTAAPSDTQAPALTTLGGADMLAFVREREIWTVRLDGSELTQLTTDGGSKSELQWMPDGRGLVYISGLCVKIVKLPKGQVNDVMCFEYAGTQIEEFEISPDGKRVAISVNQELYLVPFDLEKLRDVDRPSKVQAITDCAFMAPYASSTGAAYAVLGVRWSQDMHQLAVLMKIIYGQQQEDAVRLVDITNCSARPAPSDEFPSTRFRMGNITRLSTFAWDGYFNFAMNPMERNEGFGSLYFYNSDLHKPAASNNPIDGMCCYRDPSFSPDGSYLAFAFQDIRLGAASRTELYYVPVGTLFTGLSYTPIPLPEGFFSNVKESPQPVAHPAVTLP